MKNEKITSHHRPQCTKWFSRYSISKSGIWARWTSPLCRFSASFSIKHDVTDAILQDNEKMKVQYLRSLLFHLFQTLQAVRTWQKNFASFQFCNQNQNYCLLSKVILQKIIKLRLSQQAVLMKCKNCSGTLSLSQLGIIDPNSLPPPNIMMTLLCNAEYGRPDNNQMSIKKQK